MTLDRPGDGATMLQTFTLLLFCAGEYMEGVAGQVTLSQAPLWVPLGEGMENTEV